MGQLAEVLDSPEIAALVSELEATRWTGRPGYRFTAKLRLYDDMLTRCIDRVIGSLRETRPDMGINVAIDGSDMPAYANGQRFLYDGGPERTRYSDRDASWGHRSAVSTRSHGGFYGYKLDMAVDTATDLPLAWNVRTARDNESLHALDVLDSVRARGFNVQTCAMDKGYDLATIYDGCEERNVRPIIPLRQTPDVKAGKDKPPGRTSRRRVRTASGRSPGPMPSAARPSGVARPASASPRRSGSRPAACIR